MIELEKIDRAHPRSFDFIWWTWNIALRVIFQVTSSSCCERNCVISQIPIFSISKQKGWYNWACKLPCKNPYFIGKIRVRVCEIEWTLTTDKPTELLRRKYASTGYWIGNRWISFAPGEPQQQDTPVRNGWRPQGRRCPMELRICRADSLLVPERMPSACGSSETSRQGSELLQRGSYSCPGTPKLLITASNEPWWIW